MNGSLFFIYIFKVKKNNNKFKFLRYKSLDLTRSAKKK